MHKIISIASTLAMVGMTSLSAMAPAMAADNGFGSSHPNMAGNDSQRSQQNNYIGNYCQRYPTAYNCTDWQRNHNRWSSAQYQSFYRYHQRDPGFGGDALVAGLFGLAAGAIIAGAVNGSNNSGAGHVNACENAYRSYDLRSDTYLGYDGYRHQCRL